MHRTPEMEEKKELLKKTLEELMKSGFLSKDEVEKHLAYVCQDMIVNTESMKKKKKRCFSHEARNRSVKQRVLASQVTIILDPIYMEYAGRIYLRSVTWIVFKDGNVIGNAQTRTISFPNRHHCNHELLEYYDKTIKERHGQWTQRPSIRFCQFYTSIISKLLEDYQCAKWICREPRICRRILTCYNVYLGTDNFETGRKEPFKVHKRARQTIIEKTPLDIFIPSDSPMKPCWQMADTHQRILNTPVYVEKKVM